MKTITTTPRPPLRTTTSASPSWLTLDTLLSASLKSILHPFVSWMIPLGLRALTYPYSHAAMRFSIAWAAVVTVIFLVLRLDCRIAQKGGAGAKITEWDRELVVVTGGAQGLGRVLVQMLALKGAKGVAVLDVQSGEEMGELGGAEVGFFECDVGDREAVKRVVSEVRSHFGMGPTVLVNNAGVVNGRSILELGEEDVERNIKVNLLSHFWLIKALLPGMIAAKRGTVVTVSSVLGRLGGSQLSDYAAAKAGCIALHTSLTAELSKYPDIQTLLVAPGQLSTAMFRSVKTPSDFLAPVVDTIDVAKLVVQAIEDRTSGEISLPVYTQWVAAFDLLPPGLKNLVRRLSGVDRAMRNFSTQDKKNG